MVHYEELEGNKVQSLVHVQLRKMNFIPLVNKPYVNEVTLNEQNLYQKFC